jgi:hypothetical protein
MKRFFLVGLTLASAAASAGAQQVVSKGELPVKEEIPAEYKPPKGMCRIWLKDVPAKQQPAPTDCAAAVKNVPSNGRVIFGDADDKKEKPKGDSLPATAKGFAGKGQTPVVIKKPPRG